jgi:hypothetical protein
MDGQPSACEDGYKATPDYVPDCPAVLQVMAGGRRPLLDGQEGQRERLMHEVEGGKSE